MGSLQTGRDGDPTGESLGEHESEAEAQAQVRAFMPAKRSRKGGDPVSQRKVGRTISAATLAKLKAARDVIDELCSMGIIEEDETDEDEKPIDKEIKSATIIVTPDDQAVEPIQLNNAAGPVRPPTDMMLKLIDLELSELHH